MRSRFTRAIASTVACAIVGGLALLVAEPGATAAQSDGWASGVYPGPCKNNSAQDRTDYVNELKAFAAWRGQPIQFTMQFAPYTGVTNWLTTDQPNALFKCAVYVRQQLHVPMMFAVPMLPLYDTEDQNAVLADTPAPTLAGGAAGDYDQYWKTLAENLVAKGLGDTILRIGWEFNGNWFRWSAGPPAANCAACAVDGPANWTKYWQNIVNTMRSVPGQSFKFDYSVALGSTYANPGDTGVDPVYPGDKYVDTISVSMYDQQYGHPACTSTGVPAGCISEKVRWDNLVSETYGLNWLASFSKKRGKPVGFSEWALASTTSFNDGGGGDDAAFMKDFHTWLTGHNVAYEDYFDKDHQGNIQSLTTNSPVGNLAKDVDSINFPLAENEYQTLWAVTSGHSPSSSVLPSGFVPSSSSPASSSATASATATATATASASATASPTTTPKPVSKVPFDTPLYSLTSNRAHPKKLSKAKLTHNVFVYVRPVKPVLYAAWYIDDPKHKKKAYHVARLTPYDMVGKSGTHALAFHIGHVSRGKHTLTVMLRWKAGGYRVYTVTFTR
jgi:beta-mannanase